MLLLVYLRLYADCLTKALRGIAKNAWTLLLPMVLLLAFSTLAALLGSLGFVGGFLIGFVLAGIISCYLYFVGEVVSSSRVSITEFRTSIVKYFWSVMNVLFVFWIANLVLGAVLANNRNAGVAYLLFQLACFILLNTTPEVIYARGTYGGLATLQRSFDFIQENWIEWFVPNLAFGALYYYGTPLLLRLGGLGQLLYVVGGGALLHLIMVFRGHLFEALDGTSHRQRMHRYRTGL